MSFKVTQDILSCPLILKRHKSWSTLPSNSKASRSHSSASIFCLPEPDSRFRFERHSLPLSLRPPHLVSDATLTVMAKSFPAATTSIASDSEEARRSAAGQGQWMLRAMRTSISSQTHPQMLLSTADHSLPSLTVGAQSTWLHAAGSARVVPVAQLCPSASSFLVGLPDRCTRRLMTIAEIGSYQWQPPPLPWRAGSETFPQRGEDIGVCCRFQMRCRAVGAPRS